MENLDDKEGSKQGKALNYGYFTCVVACVHIFIFSLFLDNFKYAGLIPITAGFFILGLWTLYNYKRVAIWHNKIHVRWHVKDGVVGEPSPLLLVRVRIEGWILIALGFLMPLITISYLYMI